MPHGLVRAFDARSGALVWSWDPIPAALASETGAGNTWAPISVDTARGLVDAADLEPESRLLRRAAHRGDAVHDRRRHAQRAHGPARVALPDAAAQPVGLRPRVAACAGHDPPQWRRQGRRRASHQDGLRVRARSRDGRPAVSRRRPSRAREHGAGRSRGADATCAAAAAADREADDQGRGRVGSPVFRRQGVRARACRARQPGPLHAAEPARQRGLSLVRRRQQLGQRRLRPRDQSPGRQHDEPGRHGAGDSARRLRGRGESESRRPGHGAARNAVRHAAQDPDVVPGHAVQSAAVGRAFRNRFVHRRDTLARAARPGQEGTVLYLRDPGARPTSADLS